MVPGLNHQEQRPAVEKSPQRRERFAQINILAARARHHRRQFAIGKRARYRQKSGEQPCDQQPSRAAQVPRHFRADDKDSRADHGPDHHHSRIVEAEAARKFGIDAGLRFGAASISIQYHGAFSMDACVREEYSAVADRSGSGVRRNLDRGMRNSDGRGLVAMVATRAAVADSAHLAAVLLVRRWARCCRWPPPGTSQGLPQIRKFYVYLMLFLVVERVPRTPRNCDVWLWVAGAGRLVSAAWALEQFVRKYEDANGAHQDFYHAYVADPHHRIHEPLDDVQSGEHDDGCCW